MVNGFLFHDSIDHRVITYTRIVKIIIIIIIIIIITVYSQRKRRWRG